MQVQYCKTYNELMRSVNAFDIDKALDRLGFDNLNYLVEPVPFSKYKIYLLHGYRMIGFIYVYQLKVELKD